MHFRQHRRLPHVAAIALITVMVVALTGCGSSSSKSSSVAGTSRAGTAQASAATQGSATKQDSQSPTSGSSQAASGAPIVIGSICSCTGPLSATTATDPQTLIAWEKWTNAHGGINGHPVKVINLDDGLNATTTVNDAKQLVTQDHVVAIVGETSNLDALWAKYVQSKGVPVIGAAMFETPYETNPDFYPTGPQNPTSVYGDLAEAKALGKHQISIMYCAESPSCATYSTQFKAVAKMIGGISIVSVQKISASAPSYTANCLAAKSAGADTLVDLQASTVVTRVADTCGQQGWTPTELNLSFTPGVSWAKDPNLQGLVTVTPNQSLWNSSITPTKTYAAALAKYAPGVSSSASYNPSNASVWGSAEVFRLAAEHAKLTPSSTSADLIRGLDTFKNETVGGLTVPLTYTKGATKPNFVGCYFVSAIKNNRWTDPLNGKPQCVPHSVVAKLTALMGA